MLLNRLKRIEASDRTARTGGALMGNVSALMVGAALVGFAVAAQAEEMKNMPGMADMPAMASWEVWVA